MFNHRPLSHSPQVTSPQIGFVSSTPVPRPNDGAEGRRPLGRAVIYNTPCPGTYHGSSSYLDEPAPVLGVEVNDEMAGKHMMPGTTWFEPV